MYYRNLHCYSSTKNMITTLHTFLVAMLYCTVVVSNMLIIAGLPLSIMYEELLYS